MATTLVVLGALVAVVAASWGLLQPGDLQTEAGVASDAPGVLGTAVAETVPAAAPSAVPTRTLGGPEAAVTVTATTPPLPAAEAPGGFAKDAPTVAAAGGGLTAADRAAGLRSTRVPQVGGKSLVTVSGSAAAPGSGTRFRVRVRVEKGLEVDRAVFARFVMDTLNDPRSWGHGGRRAFARIDDTDRSRADITVVLASPTTSAAMCRPLVTRGTLSCAQGRTAILTLHRWVRGTADYGADRTGYRRYLVNHEVGHVLGQGHVRCPGRGKRAPVMMQQTKGLAGCTKNSWPYP